MKTLITPIQALKLAFGDGEVLPPETVSEADIAAAEERWIVPAIGRRLHATLLEGTHAEFCTEYLAAPVALYARALVQPRLDVRTDRSGTISPKPANGQAADEKARRRLHRQLLREARTLLERATAYLTAHEATFPEYEPTTRGSIAGGIILTDHGTRSE